MVLFYHGLQLQLDKQPGNSCYMHCLSSPATEACNSFRVAIYLMMAFNSLPSCTHPLTFLVGGLFFHRFTTLLYPFHHFIIVLIVLHKVLRRLKFYCIHPHSNDMTELEWWCIILKGGIFLFLFQWLCRNLVSLLHGKVFVDQGKKKPHCDSMLCDDKDNFQRCECFFFFFFF